MSNEPNKTKESAMPAVIGFGCMALTMLFWTSLAGLAFVALLKFVFGNG